MKLKEFKGVEVNMAHISQEDSRILHTGKSFHLLRYGILVDEYEYGYRIIIDDCTKKKELKSAGLTKEFANLYIMARKQGARMLVIDRDAEEYDDLKIFEWQ